jgi:hypothetical protein
MGCSFKKMGWGSGGRASIGSRLHIVPELYVFCNQRRFALSLLQCFSRSRVGSWRGTVSYADLFEILSDGIKHQPFFICPSPNGTYPFERIPLSRPWHPLESALCITHLIPAEMHTVLSSFATYWDFPRSDYYDDSVPLEVSFRRQSQGS